VLSVKEPTRTAATKNMTATVISMFSIIPNLIA
jgi:hypothetical protein